MKDGVRLAATLYMPDGAKVDEKFPALLEYLPYRKDDGTAGGDYPKHAYFARRGYVSVRVDIRGFGASEGIPPEREYSEQEQVDGEQVIALARPPAMVERQCRDVRHFLGRIHCDANGDAASSGIEGDSGGARDC